ncbi:MAG TPA: hypothetical protein PKX44_02080 [Methanomassiliicoccaceae archaeon]|nr:hypothetical protein [Methanomassiliicoccaceae archaeon]
MALLALAVSTIQISAQTGTPSSTMPANDAFGTTGGAEMGQEEMRQAVEGIDDPLFGILEQSGDQVTGEYVSFSAQQDGGTLTDYSLMKGGEAMPVFSEVSVEGFQPTEMNVSGPLFEAASEEFSLFVHDNPYGTMHATGNGTVSLATDPGLSAVEMEPSNPNAQAWMLTGQNVTGVLVVLNGSVESMMGGDGGGGMMEQISDWFENLFGGGSQESSSGQTGHINVTLPSEGSMIFRALPVNDAFPEANELALARHLANWTVEGEMAVMTVDSTTMWYTTEAGIMMPEVQAEPGSELTVELTPPDEVPSVMSDVEQLLYVIAVDENTLNMSSGSPTVMVNGEELNEAQDMNGIMDGSSYFMYEGKNATKVVLPLPQNATSEPVNITLSTGQ